MKHLIQKRLLCLLLTLVCVLTSVLFITAVQAEDNIASDQPVTVNAFDPSMPGRGPKSITSDYAIQLNLGAPFTSVAPSMPTWGTSDAKATISIYRWNKNFKTTVAAAPIATKRFDPLTDNAYNDFTFDEQPAGEYLVRIHEVEGQVGVWYMDATVSQGCCYENGEASKADWELRVGFAKTPVNAFLPVSKAVEESTGPLTPPDEYELPADSLVNTHPVMPDTWVFTDGLGRVSLTNAEVGDVREDRTLAMFYWTWHADLAPSGATNTTELMKQYPDAKNDYNHSAWVGTGRYCFWNEPIYGFYRTDDAWVLRRQAELLANAGVDVIFADNTNGNMTWRNSYIPLYETWLDAQKNGAVDVPKVSYLLPFGPNDGNASQIKSLYNDIYAAGKYQELWYYLDGKPMLMAHNSNAPRDLRSFFTWRAGQPEYLVNNTAIGQWGWLSTYPQATYYGTRENAKAKIIEQMTVGVAVNHNYVTHQITAMNGVNVMGRSYTSEYPDRYEKEGVEASKWGYNFSEQFDYALEKDPLVLFVTGWNEWHAWRQPSPWGGSQSLVDNALVDQFDDEFSRDLEPTKGVLQDHYYYLFVNYARKYKGVRPIPTPSVNATIDMAAGNDQWMTVEPYYAAYIGNTGNRDAKGYGSLTYTETSGRNDIIGAQIARDDEYIYFHVECAADITPYTDALWMNLYIDATGNGALDGWNSFDYIVGKTAPTADKAVLEKFTGSGYATEKVADVEYRVDGRTMTVKIAKSDLALTGDDYTVNFAWTDNVHDEGDYEKFSGDIMDFYISGDVAPGGRFKYSFISTAENAGKVVETEPDTTPVTDPETDPATNPETSPMTDAPTDAETQLTTEAPAEEGCKSSIGLGALTIALVTGMTAVTLRKKKED